MRSMMRTVAGMALGACVLTTAMADTIDATSGLAWRGFNSPTEGGALGYRMATVAEFDAFLKNAGFTYSPYYLATQTVTTIVPTVDPSTLSPSDLAAYNASMTSLGPRPTGSSAQALKAQAAWDKNASAIMEDYGLMPTSQTTKVGVGPVQNLYTSALTSAPSIDGVHRYDKFLTSSDPETHAEQAGWLLGADGQTWVAAALAYDYVPSVCPAGGSTIQYCGGRTTVSAFVGDPTGTAYDTLGFYRTDYQLGVQGLGAIMVKATAVPEPSTWALMGLGALGLLAARRRQRS